tara:strand:- start:3321 stop:4178 length:858 start_codon:yes stop_codon:yes gene_type:complete
MIIIDYNAIAIAGVVTQKMNVDENLIRHMILNTIRLYNKKHRKEYGEVVIACDHSSWRKEVFPQYKASRKKGREESSMDWNEVFRIINQVREEIRDNLPYKVIHIERCEADDIIGTLTHMKSKVEFNPDPIMIISADKDFIQLHKYNNVRQYSPMQKKFVQHDNPRLYALEHVLKGDSGDGVPNILSQDDCFVEGIRQTPITQKKIDAILADLDDGELLYAASWYRNWCRNDTLINLENTPVELKNEIINKYDIPEQRGPGKVLNYFVQNRCKLLIECIEDFNNA